MIPRPISDKFHRPLHDLRVSVIDRCNFRCTYCMPESEYHHKYEFLDEKNWLTFSEISRLIRLFVRLGASKIRLTGGEPLLRPNLTQLIKELDQINGIDDLALTTNGALLPKHASELFLAGLKRLTISLNTLDPVVFQKMNGNKGSLSQVLTGIKSAESAGFNKLKINVVVQKDVNEDGILELIRYFRGSGHILRFIEYMDVGTCNHWDPKLVVASKTIMQMIHKEFPLEPLEANYFGEVAERYRFLDGSGEIGFISSVSQPFCRTCTRARLSADGRFFTCLFSGKGTDLRNPLRSGKTDDEMLSIIQEIWNNRDDRYSEIRGTLDPNLGNTPRVEMFQVGG